MLILKYIKQGAGKKFFQKSISLCDMNPETTTIPPRMDFFTTTKKFGSFLYI